MSARARFSLDQIKDQLHRSGGNIKAAAELLGMNRDSLYKRLEVAGIDANLFRPPAEHRRPAKSTALRLRQETYERLREACFDLAFARRKDHKPADILEEFIAEAFEGWLASKVRP